MEGNNVEYIALELEPYKNGYNNFLNHYTNVLHSLLFESKIKLKKVEKLFLAKIELPRASFSALSASGQRRSRYR